MKYMLSTIRNPKIPIGPHNKPKTGSMAISMLISEVASKIFSSNIVIKVMLIENNKINFFDLKRFLILFITFTTVVFYYQYCNVIDWIIIIVNLI